MKYHSTRKSVITISIIIISLLLISAVSISRYNAQTPIQAVSEAIFSNLEIPNNYSIEIQDINESFLIKQSIKSISIEKDNKNIILINNIEINQSVIDYISYFFFKKNMKLNITIGNLIVDIDSDISDLMYSLTKIKIKDNTIAFQSKLESKDDEISAEEDFKELLNKIITKENIDLSPVLKDSLNFDINLLLKSGDIKYKSDNILVSSSIDNLSFDLNNSSIVNSFDFKLNTLKFTQDQNSYYFNKLYFLYKDKEVNLVLRKSYSDPNNLSPINFSILHTQFQYNLEKVGQINAKFNNFELSTPEIKVESDNIASQFRTNFNDFSIILSPEGFRGNLETKTNEGNLSFEKANIGLSSVNERLSFYFNNESYLNISLNEEDYLFEDIDLSLFSSENFFDTINLRLSSSSFNITNDISVLLKDVVFKGDIDINNQLLLSDNKLDFDKLNNINSALNNVIFNLKAKINIKNDNNEINTEINSFVDINDNFESINSSIYFENLLINDFNEALNGEIYYYGPLEIAEGKVQTLETIINYKDTLTLSATANMEKYISNNNVNASIVFNNLPVNEFSQYIIENLAFLKNYYDNETTLKGSIYYAGNIPTKENKVDSRITSSVVASDFIFLDERYDVSFNMKSNLKDNIIRFENLSSSLLDYRLSFEGEYEINNRDLNGKLLLNNILSNTELASVSLNGNNNFNITDFDFNVNSLDNFNFNGEITFKNYRELLINSTLKFDKDILDLYIIADIENLKFKLICEDGIDINLIIDDEINASMLLDSLLLKSLNNSIFNGEIDFNYKNTNKWEFNLNDFQFNYNELFKLSAKGLINQNNISLNSIDYINSKFDNLYHGELFYSGPKYITLIKNNFKLPYSLNLSYGDEFSQRIEATLFNDDGEFNKIFLNVSDYNISSILNYDNEILLDTKIIGKTDFNKIHNIKGNFEITETVTNLNINNENNIDEDNTSILANILSIIPFINLPENDASTSDISDQNLFNPIIHIKSNLNINNNNILLENINLSINSLTLSDTSVLFDTDDIELDIKSKIKLIVPSRVVNQKHEFKLNLALNLYSFVENIKNAYSIENFDFNTFNYIRDNFEQLTDFDTELLNNISGNLKISDLELFEDEVYYEKLFKDEPSDLLNFDDIDGSFIIKNGEVSFESPYVNSNIDLINKEGTLDISKDYVFSSNITFDYQNQFDVYMDNIIVPSSLINKILNIKLMKFYGDDFTGNLMLSDITNNLKFYGEASSTNFRMKSLYTYDNVATAPNITVIFNEDKIYSNNFKAEYYDTDLNETVYLKASSSIDMPNLKFKYFTIDINIDDYIRAYMPLINMNFTIDTKVKDYFVFSSDGKTSYIEGDIRVKDSVIRSGYDLLPWIKPVNETNGNMIIRTGVNNTFYYPYFDNPIVKLTLKKDQTLDLEFDTFSKNYSASGKMDILQGEIFYFQKNFYLNDGSLVLKKDPITNRLVPIISLNATLREIDSLGNTVDINLQLINSSLNSINPIFSSTPIKTQQEIMEILGQSFSSTTTSNTVASIASAATSVISSLGYLDTGGGAALNNVIAQSLNLDFFSLNSNVVENILLDTLIEDPRYSSYTPLARYLNNTTIYLGKYITDASRMKILLNLVATEDKNITSFIADDLSLDFEMSYEIDTELADFSFFTNPTQLSILNILDTIGFSVTKTLHFR